MKELKHYAVKVDEKGNILSFETFDCDNSEEALQYCESKRKAGEDYRCLMYCNVKPIIGRNAHEEFARNIDKKDMEHKPPLEECLLLLASIDTGITATNISPIDCSVDEAKDAIRKVGAMVLGLLMAREHIETEKKEAKAAVDALLNKFKLEKE